MEQSILSMLLAQENKNGIDEDERTPSTKMTKTSTWDLGPWGPLWLLRSQLGGNSPLRCGGFIVGIRDFAREWCDKRVVVRNLKCRAGLGAPWMDFSVFEAGPSSPTRSTDITLGKYFANHSNGLRIARTYRSSYVLSLYFDYKTRDPTRNRKQREYSGLPQDSRAQKRGRVRRE